MAFYKFNLLVSHSYLCHRLDAKWIIWDLVLSSWLLEWTSGMILHLTHLYFPSAFMADREVSSSYNQSRTTTRIFAVSLPFFYYWKHCLPLFQNPSISSAPPPHQNHSLGEQWPPQTKCTWSFQPLLLPEDVQHSALKTIDHTLFLRCLIPNSCLFQPLRRFFSGFFVDCSSSTQPQMLEPFSIYSWFLHFLPPLSLFLPLLPPLPDWVVSWFPWSSMLICLQFLKLYPQLSVLFWTADLLASPTRTSHMHFIFNMCQTGLLVLPPGTHPHPNVNVLLVNVSISDHGTARCVPWTPPWWLLFPT